MDVAALNLSVDSTDVVKATTDLDKFAASADRAAASTGKLSGSSSGTAKLGQDYARAAQAANQASGSIMRIADTVARADSAMRDATGASAAMRAANDNVTRSFANADAQVIAYREHLQRLVAAQNAQTQAATTNAGAVANVARVSDVAAVSVAKVDTATRGAESGMKLASAAGTFLSGILGGVLGVALSAVTALLQEYILALFDSKDALDVTVTATDNLATAQNILGKMFDLSTGKIKNNTQALRDQIYMQQLAMKNQAIIARQEATEQLSEAGLGRTTSAGRAGSRLFGFFTQERPVDTERRIAAQEAQGRKLESLLTGLEQGAIGREEVGRIIDRMENLSDAQRRQLQAAASRAYEAGTANQAARDMGSALNGKLPPNYITPDDGASGRAARTAGRATRATELSDEAKAFQERSRATDQYIASLEQEIAKIGLSGEALRKYEVAQALSRATTDAQREAIEKLSDQREAGLKTLRQTQELEAAQKALGATRRDIAGGVDIELQTMHLVGAEREREVLRIQRQIEMTDLLAKIKKAEADGNVALADTYRQLAEAVDEKYAKELQAVNGREQFEQYTKGINDAKAAAQGFFQEWIGGIRNGENVFKAFTKSINNLVDRMINNLIEQMVNNMFSGLGGAGGMGQMGGMGAMGSGGLAVGLGTIIGTYLGKGIVSLFKSIFADGGTFGTAQQYAYGGAFDRAQRFANGGSFTNQIITQPTLFKFAKGTKLGEMGEAGPEAVMPLGRTPDGKLGVHAMGGRGSGRPTINFSPVINNHNSFAGAIGIESIAAMQRQTAHATEEQIKQNLHRYLQELDIDGAVSRG